MSESADDRQSRVLASLDDLGQVCDGLSSNIKFFGGEPAFLGTKLVTSYTFSVGSSCSGISHCEGSEARLGALFRMTTAFQSFLTSDMLGFLYIDICKNDENGSLIR